MFYETWRWSDSKRSISILILWNKVKQLCFDGLQLYSYQLNSFSQTLYLASYNNSCQHNTVFVKIVQYERPLCMKAYICICAYLEPNFCPVLKTMRGPEYRIRYSDSLRAGQSGVEYRWRWDFPQHSRPPLGSTQPPVSEYRRIPSGEVAGAWR